MLQAATFWQNIQLIIRRRIRQILLPMLDAIVKMIDLDLEKY